MSLRMDLREYGYTPEDIWSERLSVWDASELVDLMPNGCHWKRDIGGEWAWTMSQLIAVEMLHAQQLAVWMNSKDGSSNRNRPRRMPPPRGRLDQERKEARIVSQVSKAEARRLAREERLRLQKQQEQTESVSSA
jgi:hypothetical protein